MTTPTEVAALAAELRAEHLDWREGQAAFNALTQLAPGVAEKIRGSVADPFDHDRLLPAFYGALADGLIPQACPRCRELGKQGASGAAAGDDPISVAITAYETAWPGRCWYDATGDARRAYVGVAALCAVEESRARR